MAYLFEITETLERKLRKLKKKNIGLFNACKRKIAEITKNPPRASALT